MILTDEEMQQVRRHLETQAGLDEELMRRCGQLVHLGAFDEAVRSAFVLLEERLRKATGKEDMSGVQLANYAFNATNGPLAKLLGHDQAERDGLRELYSGAFRLFRNPAAHGVVSYSAAEGRAIIGLVDLMLKMLQRAAELPPPGMLPENVEKAITDVEQVAGPGAASRYRLFLGKCVKMGLKPASTREAKYWIPFRRYALVRFGWWEKPRSHSIAVFYIGSTPPILQFPVSDYYAYVIGFDTEHLVEELETLGFRPAGKNRNPTVELRTHNDEAFFHALLDLVTRIGEELEDSLGQE